MMKSDVQFKCGVPSLIWTEKLIHRLGRDGMSRTHDDPSCDVRSQGRSQNDVESNSSTMVVLWLPSCCGSSKSIWSQEHRKVVNDLMVKTNMCIQESHIIQFIITVFTGAGSS